MALTGSTMYLYMTHLVGWNLLNSGLLATKENKK